MLVLDAGGVDLLAQRSPRSAARLADLRRAGLWPAIVPSIVLVECLRGRPGADAPINAFVKTCDVVEALSIARARRAAALRTAARRGSAVDAAVVALAEPHGVVLTSDPGDLRALSAHAIGVTVEEA